MKQSCLIELRNYRYVPILRQQNMQICEGKELPSLLIELFRNLTDQEMCQTGKAHFSKSVDEICRVWLLGKYARGSVSAALAYLQQKGYLTVEDRRSQNLPNLYLLNCDAIMAAYEKLCPVAQTYDEGVELYYRFVNSLDHVQKPNMVSEDHVQKVNVVSANHVQNLNMPMFKNRTSSKLETSKETSTETRNPLTPLRESNLFEESDAAPLSQESKNQGPEEIAIEATAKKLYARHPKQRRAPMSEIKRQLRSIVKAVPVGKRRQLLDTIDKNHEIQCKSPDWVKSNGQYAKGLANWLSPTLHRWEEVASPNDPETQPLEVETGLPQWQGYSGHTHVNGSGRKAVNG